jgi:ribose transport system substrate-binding protein
MIQNRFLGTKLIVTAVTALAIFASVSTTTLAADKKKPIKIGVSFQELSNPYFVVMKQAIDEAAATIGAEVIYADARHDVTKQLNDIEDLVQKKIDILLINPTDSVGVEAAVVDAKKAGVVVVAVDAQANGPIDSFVGSKNFCQPKQGDDLLRCTVDKAIYGLVHRGPSYIRNDNSCAFVISVEKEKRW